MNEEVRKHRSRLRPAEPQQFPTHSHLERPQDEELHLYPSDSAVAATVPPCPDGVQGAISGLFGGPASLYPTKPRED